MDRGFKVRIGSGVGLRSGYFAGSDKIRQMDLEEMFADEEVKALFCTRGGYGSARLLETMQWDIVRQNPKILIGFSDITALSMGILSNTGLVTFAGPMVAAELAQPVSTTVERALWETLMTPRSRCELPIGKAVKTIRAGRAEGTLIGGNLSVLCSLIGSRYLPDFSGAILFIEDVGESVYRIDRMLLQLKYAGLLNSLAGVVLGTFTAIPKQAADRELDDVLEEYLLPLNVPLLSGIPFGHIQEKITLPLGATVLLDASKGKLTVLHAMVK